MSLSLSPEARPLQQRARAPSRAARQSIYVYTPAAAHISIYSRMPARAHLACSSSFSSSRERECLPFSLLSIVQRRSRVEAKITRPVSPIRSKLDFPRSTAIAAADVGIYIGTASRSAWRTCVAPFTVRVHCTAAASNRIPLRCSLFLL